jgi:hypothetical protein
MEFFLSSMAILLITALIVFLVVPRLGATVLVGLSFVLLVGCLYSHYTLFSSEYRYSTWQERLKWMAPTLMYTALGIAVVMFLGTLYSGKSVMEALPLTNLASGSNNSVTETINNTAKVANAAVNNVVETVNNSLGISTTPKNNRAANVITNLGGLLNTPKQNNQNRRNFY